MRKLYPDYGALRVRKVYDTFERFYVSVRPDTLDRDEIDRGSVRVITHHILWGYAPFGNNCGSFDYDGSDTAGGKALRE